MATENPLPSDYDGPHSWFMFRPTEVTMSLPIDYRWEFTRRHPYYQLRWRVAQRHHEHRDATPEEQVRGEIAVQVLAMIGVAQTTIPPDPRLGPEALGSQDLGGIWADGAVAPATFRTLASILLLGLPKAERAQLGRLLIESSEFESRDFANTMGIFKQLAKLQDPAWNCFPDAPFVSINLQMPQRAIGEAIDRLVRKWKGERGIAEQRRRDDKLDEYLAAWDMREGWADGNYESTREKTFETISRETRIPIGTVINRYRSAFWYLAGHDYTPARWFHLMSPLKLSPFVRNQAGGGLIMRRPWRSPRPRPVPESVLLPGRKEFDPPEFLAAAAVAESDIASVELALDIDTLLAKGFNDDAIIEELELTLPSARELVAEIRRRHEDR